tara:strand:- start:236 stop:382 length:147 start_codon:yes stop_codon:yes gene_type:complete
MKQKISITIDEEHIELIENILQDSRFRNRSHVIEHSLRKFLDDEGEEE